MALASASARSISAWPMPRSRNGGSTVSGPSSSAGVVADQDRRQPHRADQQRADARGERQFERCARPPRGCDRPSWQSAPARRCARCSCSIAGASSGVSGRMVREMSFMASPRRRARLPSGAGTGSICCRGAAPSAYIRAERRSCRWDFWSTAFGATTASIKTRQARPLQPADHQFRNWVTPDGSPGPSGEGGFPAEPGRYHLYVSLACPWAHRTMIFRKLKRLENVISMSVTSLAHGRARLDLRHEPRLEPATRSTARRSSRRSICAPTRNTPAASPCRCCGTSSATPSSTTNRPRSSACSTRRSTRSPTSAPTITRPSCAREIDASTSWSTPNVNNGVYRAGFATTQAAYEEAFRNVFAALDELERGLSRQRYVAATA